MIAEKVFTNEKGCYKVEVMLDTNSTYKENTWRYNVCFHEKGKRKWIYINPPEDEEWRKASRKERILIRDRFFLSIIPFAWLREVQEMIILELRKPFVKIPLSNCKS